MRLDPLKYVIVKRLGLRVAMVFDPFISHAQFRDMNPLSAGFCAIQADAGKLVVRAWGRSESLDLDSDPAVDANLIEAALERRLACQK